MGIDKNFTSSEYKKKVFTRVYNNSISALEAERDRPHKKITPSVKSSGLREQFKQSFLPLLIDLFEMRQIVANHKKTPMEDPFLAFKKQGKSPKEILQRLTEMQSDIEETKKWCEGIILQISKGVSEVKEVLESIDKTNPIDHPCQETEITNKRKKSPLWDFLTTLLPKRR